MPGDDSLRGCRVLLVEDETLVALLLEDMLEEIGCTVAAFAASVREGVKLAESVDLDAAILDVNVGGVEVYPVAEALAARRIPFVFCSGYGASGLQPPWCEKPVLAKPFVQTELESALRRVCAAKPPDR